MSSVHVTEATPLDSYREQIESLLDKTVLEVGALLARALEEHGRTQWWSWVDCGLPFTPEKAEQLVAIHQAFQRLPEGLLSQLPRPYQALFALRTLTQEQLEDAAEKFELGPDTTVAEARLMARHYRLSPASSGGTAPRAANIRAAKLMERDPDELDPMVLGQLRDWITR